MCQLIGRCQAHLASLLPSLWKEEPLGVCWLTGKVLTLGGRRGKPEQAVPGNLQAPSLRFGTPFSSGETGGGSKGLGYSPFAETVETRSCSGADPAERGAPPRPHSPGFHSGSLQREGTARGPCASPFLELQARSPAPSGAPAACPRPHGGAGCPRRPHPRLALAPFFQLRQPERAHRGSRTWARGRRRPLLPEPKPEQGRSPSMLREPRPPCAQPLAPAEHCERAKQRRGTGR